MKKSKKFWSNPWIVSIGSSVLMLLVTTIIDFITKERIFSTIKAVVSFICNMFCAFLNFKLKVWWVLVGLAIIVLGLFFYSKYLDSKQSGQESPEFMMYTKDTILGYQWRWHWEKDYSGKYSVDDLHPICSKCETPLTREYGYGQPICLRCGERYCNNLPGEREVKMLISDNVRRKYYPDE